MSNSSRNGSELAKTMRVDDGHVNAPQESSIMVIAPGPQNGGNSAQNVPELAKIVSVDDRHVSVPWGSTTMEIALGPLKCE